MTQQENGKASLIYLFQIGNNWRWTQRSKRSTHICVFNTSLRAHATCHFVCLHCFHCSFRMSDVGMHDFILTGATCWRGQTQTANNKMMRIRASSRLIFLCNASAIFWRRDEIIFVLRWPAQAKCCCFGVYLNWFLFWAIICGSLFIADSSGFLNVSGFRTHRIKESPMSNKKFGLYRCRRFRSNIAWK